MTPAGKTCRCFYAEEGRTDFGAGEGLAGLWGALLFRMAIRRGAGGRAESHPASMTKDNFAVSNSPWRGMTRRLGADWDWPSQGALTLFFRWRKKSVQKKASGTATPEKSPLLPIFERGSSQCRAQRSWPAYACYRARSELAFFRRQNGRAFFPPLPIAALLRRSWRVVGLLLASWDASVWLENFAAWMNRLFFFSRAGVGQAYPLRVGMLPCCLKNDATQKASGISNPRWPF